MEEEFNDDEECDTRFLEVCIDGDIEDLVQLLEQLARAGETLGPDDLNCSDGSGRVSQILNFSFGIFTSAAVDLDCRQLPLRQRHDGNARGPGGRARPRLQLARQRRQRTFTLCCSSRSCRGGEVFAVQGRRHSGGSNQLSRILSINEVGLARPYEMLQTPSILR